jgi:hypothetical protein
MLSSPRCLDPALDDRALSNADARRREFPFGFRCRLDVELGRVPMALLVRLLIEIGRLWR